MYCVKCRTVTGTDNERQERTATGRMMLKGQCTNCKTNKNKFLKKQKGSGLVNDILNSDKMPEMHLRGLSGKYSYCGPGTKLNKRLDKNKKPKKGYEPINKLDEICYQHDLAYDNMSDTANRLQADKVMLENIGDILKGNKLNWKEKADARLVKGIIGVKSKLGLGKKKK